MEGRLFEGAAKWRKVITGRCNIGGTVSFSAVPGLLAGCIWRAPVTEGWQEHPYVVIRRTQEGPQGLLQPAYTVILVSRDDLPLEELVADTGKSRSRRTTSKGLLIDLDLHHSPCRAFHTNQAYYLCGQLAQLLLRLIQYRLLPAKACRHGIRPLIRHLTRTATRLVRSARRWRLDFSKTAYRLDWLYYAACRLE